jgi:hypothetical protein
MMYCSEAFYQAFFSSHDGFLSLPLLGSTSSCAAALIILLYMLIREL